MRIATALALLVLAGCGADGAPVRPKVAGTVTIGSDGVSSQTAVTIGNGPVTAGVSF